MSSTDWIRSITAISCRDCGFPQELVFRLNKYSRIQQIQLLAHEYKVRSKWTFQPSPLVANRTHTSCKLPFPWPTPLLPPPKHCQRYKATMVAVRLD